MSAPVPEDISVRGILSEARRIIKANKNHFNILSLVLLLPYSFILLSYLTIFPLGSQPSSNLLLGVYCIVLFVFSLSSIGTITYSAFHGYYNRPLDLIATLKSLTSSIIPLFSTMMVLQLIVTLIGFVVGILGAVLLYTSNNEYFTLAMVLVVFLTFVFVTYIQLKFFIANVVVVVESKWGYAPLKRSAYLMKGAKMVAFKMMMMLGLLNSLIVWGCFLKPWKADGVEFWMFMLFRMLAGSFWMTVVMKYCLVANVVLYIYCMKLHGELPVEIHAEEEYVSLIIDDNGNKSVADIVHA